MRDVSQLTCRVGADGPSVAGGAPSGAAKSCRGHRHMSSRQVLEVERAIWGRSHYEEHIGPDAYHAIWQTIAHRLGGQNLASIRAVCRTSRKAVDDAVTAITVPSDAVQGTLPGHERFPACKQYTFVDPSEDIPRYVIHSCCRYSKGRTVLICGESGWRAPHIRDWIRMNQDELSEVSLILQLCEEHQEVDLSAYLQHILAIGPGVRLSLLGLWCEVTLSTLCPHPMPSVGDCDDSVHVCAHAERRPHSAVH